MLQTVWGTFLNATDDCESCPPDRYCAGGKAQPSNCANAVCGQNLYQSGSCTAIVDGFSIHHAPQRSWAWTDQNVAAV